MSETVLYCVDQRVWEHAYVSLYSLLVNNRDTPLDVYVFAEQDDPRFPSYRDWLKDVHPEARVVWQLLDHRLPSGTPTGKLSIAIYYRLFMDRLLPAGVERVLYLDADTVVLRGLHDLFATSLHDRVLAATPNRCHIGQAAHAARLELPSPRYFNSGVMRIDLPQWRRDQIGERCLEHVYAHLDDEKLRFHDQDALNSVLAGEWNALSPAFNYVWWTPDPDVVKAYDEEVGSEGPAIIHFAGLRRKPWHPGCPHPLESEYWRYKIQTPFGSRWSHLRNRLAGRAFKLQRLLGLKKK